MSIYPKAPFLYLIFSMFYENYSAIKGEKGREREMGGGEREEERELAGREGAVTKGAVQADFLAVTRRWARKEKRRLSQA